MGFVDRGGGREAKGVSLRRSKKNPGAAAARVKREGKEGTVCAAKAYAVPPVSGSPLDVVDCSVAILSRKFDADRDRVVDRAKAEGGCVAMVTWCGEVQRQEALSQLCGEVPGKMFCAIGVHPDNVDRTNKRAHQGWVDQVNALARHSQCVAILTGLDLTREQATHFSQESLVKLLCECASSLRLPLVLHLNPDTQSISRFLELWGEIPALADCSTRVVIRDAVALSLASRAFAKFVVETPTVFAAVSARFLFGAEASVQEAAAACLKAIPLERLLIATDSPWHTPQNLPDAHLRELHNDPANLPFVVEAVAACKGVTAAEISQASFHNTGSVFFAPSGVAAASDGGSAATLDQSVPCQQRDGEAGEEDDDEEEEEDDRGGGNGDGDTAGGESDPEEGEAEEPLIALHPPSGDVATTFSCVKCRRELFRDSARVTHRANAPREKVSKRLSGGECGVTFFLRVEGSEDDPRVETGSSGLALVLLLGGDSVSCAGCNSKVGTVATNAACPCGAVMQGRTARIVASRVESCDAVGRASDAELLHRAEKEREQLLDAAASTDDDDENGDKHHGGKKRRAKHNVKANNRSNMSNFRNKNFAPGLLAQSGALLEQALARPTSSSAGQQQQQQQKPATRKGRNGRRGDSSESD